jgi:hypothetical protein
MEEGELCIVRDLAIAVDLTERHVSGPNAELPTLIGDPSVAVQPPRLSRGSFL